MEKKYTEGPWEYCEDDYSDGDVGIIKGMGRIAQVDDGYTICQMCDFVNPELTANAQLIAAAPELLEAVENLLAYIDTEDMRPLNCNLARAAIKKAKGE